MLVHNISMSIRTNIHLDDDAYKFANAYAGAKGLALGAAVSELLLRAEETAGQPVQESPRLKKMPRGYLVIAGRPEDPAINPEMVKELSEDSFD
jgi:hypothetical protein